MKFEFNKKLSRAEIGVLILSVLSLVVVFLLLSTHVRHAREEGAFDRRGKISWMFDERKRERPAPPSVDKIETWMNFKYVNVVFDLPDGYLEETLGIEDEKYPNVSISKYLKKSGRDTETFMKELREAVAKKSQPKEN